MRSVCRKHCKCQETNFSGEKGNLCINVVQIHEEQKYRKVVKKTQCSIHLDIYSIDRSQKTTNVY